jgi:hypothetical protein
MSAPNAVARGSAGRALLAVAVLAMMILGSVLGGGASATAAPATGTTNTFTTVADAFVTTAFPTTNFGSSPELRVSNPQRTSYLKFDLSGLSGVVTSATLQLSSPAPSSIGYDVRGVSDSTWSESTITQSNAPAPASSVTGSSGAYNAGWTSVNVTPLVTGNGLVSFAVTRTSSNLITLSSKEAGASTAPQLVVTTAASPDTQPPTTPAGLGANRLLGSNQIVVFWSPSADDTAVAGYTVYRDGIVWSTLPPTQTSYTDSSVVLGETYKYRVDAFDPAGNRSAQSNSDTVTDSPCNLCVMSGSAHHALEVNGGSHLTVPFGRIWVSSTDSEAADATGGSVVAAGKSIRVVGGVNASGGSVFSPTPVHDSAVSDPLAGAPVPTTTGPSFGSLIVNGGTVTAQPGTYTTLGASSGTLILSPGTYVITQGFSNSGSATITGNGVILYFTGNAGIHLSGGSVTTLVSPKRAFGGTVSDMLIFFDRSNSAQIKTDDVTATFKGHIYAPAATLTVQQLTVVDDLIVVNTVENHSGGKLCLCS